MTTLSSDQILAIHAATQILLPDATSFLTELVRIDTRNPPGNNYRKIVEFIGKKLESFGYDVKYILLSPEEADELAPHGEKLERINVIGTLPPNASSASGKTIHFNGHVDVVHEGDISKWKFDPFGGEVKDGKIYGRGVSDMKGGIAAQLYAIEALKMAGLKLRGTIEQSAVVDEETTGIRNAGMGYLIEKGYITKEKTTAVIITEPLNSCNVCCGHRGTIWGDITFYGKSSHGSMPALGVNAIQNCAKFITVATEELGVVHAKKLDTNVIPLEAQKASLAFTIIQGGTNTNSVPDICKVSFDRRLVEGESLDQARSEIHSILQRLTLENSNFIYKYEERYSVKPTWVDPEQPLSYIFRNAIQTVTGKEATVVCSPGSDDQRFVVHNAGLEACIVYGPGNIKNVHCYDEELSLEDLRIAIEVMAIGAAEIVEIE
jgi:succinyl-diaminopimelate desuccinylase